MKLLQDSNKLLITFLVALFIINIIQGYTTELLADEAYYWMYSNFLDWGYFDHPPMVAVWISISKLFFSSGELSVRFFSAITLSITFYFVWLLIEHPKKKENTSLFILIIATMALFNVYGFITVPDTPLLFFMAIFLIGYQKYLKEKSNVSYLIITIGIAGMMYSKYQAILIVFFVLLSNLKVLKDYKIWLMTLVVICLYLPHLYWQYNNDYPSFRYHLYERTQNKSYKIGDSLMIFVNMLAIVGFTFPILYKAIFKNLKSKNLFLKALNFIFIGFIVFFFISTFKGPTQAQWIVPISFSLVIISFNYIVNNPNTKKVFTKLAITTLIVTLGIRFVMANDILPIQMEMHGNKAWVSKLHKKLGEKDVLFVNSYQNTSWYWFYSNKRAYQYNTWFRRKNHYDLLDYNKGIKFDEITLVGDRVRQPIDSVILKNDKKIFLTTLKNYQKEGITFKTIETPTIQKNTSTSFKVTIENPNNIDLKKLRLQAVLRDQKRRTLKTANPNDHPNAAQVFKAKLTGEAVEVFITDFSNDFSPKSIQIIGNINKKTQSVRMGTFECTFIKK